MCLHEDVVDDCKQCIQKVAFSNSSSSSLNAQDNGQSTETIICDLEVLCQTTSTISRRDKIINSDISTPLTILKEKATANNWSTAPFEFI